MHHNTWPITTGSQNPRPTASYHRKYNHCRPWKNATIRGPQLRHLLINTIRAWRPPTKSIDQSGNVNQRLSVSLSATSHLKRISYKYPCVNEAWQKHTDFGRKEYCIKQRHQNRRQRADKNIPCNHAWLKNKVSNNSITHARESDNDRYIVIQYDVYL